MNNKTHASVKVSVSKASIDSAPSDHITPMPRHIPQDMPVLESDVWYIIETYTSEEAIPEDFEENQEER